MTTVGDGLFEYGGKPAGSGLALPLMGGSGKCYFVDPANGSDSNAGTKPSSALATVGAAYAKCTDKAGDTVYYLNDGNTTGSSREATIPLTWSKDNTHLVGWCAPTMVSQRCRITPLATAALTANPVITLSGHGCVFANVAIQHWGSTDSIASRGMDVTGNRNYIYNCHIVGISHANVGDEANGVDLRVTGSENTFERCVVGIDSVARGNNAANTNIQFGSGSTDQAARNIFKDCILQMWADDTEPVFVKTTTAFDTDRWNLMERCNFINTGTSTIDAAISWADTTGKLFLKDCAFYGMTDVTAADSSYVLLYGTSGASVVDVGHYKGVDIS